MAISTEPATVGVGIDLLKVNSPIIDYTALDRASLSRDLREYASFQFHDQWTNFQNSEFAIVFLELLAYIGDMVFYQINAVIGESHPSTCVRRQSFIDIAKSYDYFMPGPVGSDVVVTLTSDVGSLPYPISATTFKLSATNGTIFMPIANESIIAAEQDVAMKAGDFQDNVLLSVSTGAPGQRYSISQTSLQTPLLYDNVVGEGLVPTLEIFVDGAEWARVRLEADAQSTDEVYFLRTDEDELVTVFFGDGINGKVPPNGVDIRFNAFLGTGKTSNVNARTIRGILTPIPGLNAVTNKLKASNGSPRQSLQVGKAALPASISSNNRAVTRRDFSDVLFRNEAPGGYAKASATRGVFRDQIVWLVPDGDGPLTTVLRNEVSEFLRDFKILGHKVDVRRATNIPLRMVLDVYVSADHRADDVIGRVRQTFVTELVNTVEVGTGAFDFANVGLGGRDDAGNPQITVMRVQNLVERLQISGLQKLEVRELRTRPVTKLPHTRLNTGNGEISSVNYLLPRDVPRREFRILFTSATTFKVFRRIVGRSTILTDNQLIDDRLDLNTLPETADISSLGPIQLSPDRAQEVLFAVDTNPLVTQGSVVQVVSGGSGSVFGSASTGSPYYLEFEDGTDALSGAILGNVTYNSSFGDLQWVVTSGDVAFVAGDELFFDVFPTVGDVTLRPDDFPQFFRDVDGSAPDLVTNEKTQV